MIDWRTFEIPFGINVFLFVLGVVATGLDGMSGLAGHLIGMVCVSGVLGMIYLVSGGAAIGGGDVKLMGACGFVLGVWPGLIQAVLSLSLAVLAGLVECRLQKQPLSAVRLPLAPFFCFGGVSAYWLTAFALQI